MQIIRDSSDGYTEHSVDYIEAVPIANRVSQPPPGFVNDDTTWQLCRSGSTSYSKSPPSGTTTAIVFVVADDEYIRRSLEQLIVPTGLAVESHSTAEQILSASRPTVPCCLLLDLSLSTVNDLDLQQEIWTRKNIPIVFITNRADVRVTVQAMKAGAVDVLAAPVSPEHLSSAVEAAIEVSRMALRRDAAVRELRACYASLTPREREVMGLVVAGLLNKQVAFELGISEITVKAHRGQVMRKMRADSLPHLVRMTARLAVDLPASTNEFM
jgi:FixJ family two-component response regulator